MENSHIQNIYKEIPSVDMVLGLEKVEKLISVYGRNSVVNNVRRILDGFRKKPKPMNREDITNFIIEELEKSMNEKKRMDLKKVINATGIILHTNLGRAPLPDDAIELIKEVSEGYSNLEFDLKKGRRGSRYSHIEHILKEITGAESAMIVNNNAAAVFLCLNTLGSNKEVIVSRGEEVEIGGGFRIPDIILRSSAKIVEVGTTNRTRISDYSNAITCETSILLKVHTSNYKITGFTESVSLEELAALARKNDLIAMEDLGSGSLYDLSSIGLPYEPTVQDSILKGADIVTFSGDKLLGGPQCGIILGKEELIDRIKENPLSRILRCDKLTIAAISSVLKLYLNPDTAVEHVPILKIMALKEDELIKRANELKKILINLIGEKAKVDTLDVFDEVGGGSLPGATLKGKAVSIRPIHMNINFLQEELRNANIPIVCRINNDSLILNVRTIETKYFKYIAETFLKILGE